MIRRLAAIALLLLLSAPARAVPITQYAFGRVVRDQSVDFPNFRPPRTFALGEGVTLRITYDLDPPVSPPGGRATVAFDLLTAGGFESHQGFATGTSVQGAWPDLRLRASLDPWLIDLQYAGGLGSLLYEVDFPNGVVGFRATVQRTDTFLPADSPIPEPSTLALGAIGAGVLGLAWTRRRRAVLT
jgi:hypothetical protein